MSDDLRLPVPHTPTRCVCGKLPYRSADAALRAHRRLGARLRAYVCDLAAGTVWHVTNAEKDPPYHAHSADVEALRIQERHQRARRPAREGRLA